MHATAFKGNADSSSGIFAGAQVYAGDTAANPNTTPLRDQSGNISAVVFNGIASQANMLTWLKNIQQIKHMKLELW